MIRAVRGATTAAQDTPELLDQAVEDLATRLVELNGIREEDVLSIFISVTHDIRSDSPARIVRETLGWSSAPFMSAAEPDIEGMPARCVRILIQFETDRPQSEIRPVYLNGAMVLRPDLT